MQTSTITTYALASRLGSYMTRRRKSVWLLSAACACLLVMVLTHVAKALHILPGMGWGLPNTPGNYLDLASAIAGVVLLLAADVVWLLH